GATRAASTTRTAGTAGGLRWLGLDAGVQIAERVRIELAERLVQAVPRLPDTVVSGLADAVEALLLLLERGLEVCVQPVRRVRGGQVAHIGTEVPVRVGVAPVDAL